MAVTESLIIYTREQANLCILVKVKSEKMWEVTY